MMRVVGVGALAPLEAYEPLGSVGGGGGVAAAPLGGVKLPSSGQSPRSGAGRAGSFGAGGGVGVPWFPAAGSRVP
jgi:hypothetical protein